MSAENKLINTSEKNPVSRDLTDLLKDLAVTGKESLALCGDQEDISYSIFRDWGIQAVGKIAGKMPDLETKIGVLREMISIF